MTIQLAVRGDARRPAGATPPIYLDNAATTPLCAEAVEALRSGLDLFGNPSSHHPVGEAAREAMEVARLQVAALFGCAGEEVVFTSGGSEANALAIMGTALSHYRERAVHIVTTGVEHSAVLQSVELAHELGADITVVPPDHRGWIDPDSIRNALRRDTTLVSVMHANNEIGVIQPIADIARIVHNAGALLHVDAVQTAGKLDLSRLAADLVTISGHKFHGPKGVGALRVAPGVRVAPLLRGGPQETGRRAGTENTLGMLGMGAAAQVALHCLSDPAHQRRRSQLRQALLDGFAELGGTRVLGNGAPRLPETLSVSFAGVRGDTLVDLLGSQGVCVSAGSACHSASSAPSHVLSAMGVPLEQARGTVRFSCGRFTQPDDVYAATAIVVATVRRLRSLNPAWASAPELRAS